MKIAILDSGINYDCIDNPDCIISSSNCILQGRYIKTGTDCKDVLGHGTYCLQTIRHISSGSEFIVIKILDDNGLTCDDVLIEALRRLLYLDVDIINLSLSVTDSSYNSNELKNICDQLYTQGKIIVAAVQNGTNSSVPASYDSVIGVSGILADKPNLIKIFLNNKIDIGADCLPILVKKDQKQWDYFSGNSKSTCVVTGFLANILEKQKSRNKENLLNLLKDLPNASVGVQPTALPYFENSFFQMPHNKASDFQNLDVDYAEKIACDLFSFTKKELWEKSLFDEPIPDAGKFSDFFLKMAEHENIKIDIVGLGYQNFEWFANALLHLKKVKDMKSGVV